MLVFNHLCGAGVSVLYIIVQLFDVILKGKFNAKTLVFEINLRIKRVTNNGSKLNTFVMNKKQQLLYKKVRVMKKQFTN